MSIEIIIDGTPCTCEKGEYLAQIAKRNGIFIPMLCGANDALLGRGSCRVCIVEVIESGRVKVVASCIYPVMKPCEVNTRSERIIKERGVILSLLSCLAPESELIAAMAREYGVEDTDAFVKVADAHTCILCGLCAEACKTLGAHAISTVGRGVEKKISTPYDEESPVCIGCASCASVCPTDNIPVQTRGDTRTIWGKDFTVARCSVCGAEIGTEESLAYASDRVERTSDRADEQGESGIDTDVTRLCSKHRRIKSISGFIGAECKQ